MREFSRRDVRIREGERERHKRRRKSRSEGRRGEKKRRRRKRERREVWCWRRSPSRPAAWRRRRAEVREEREGREERKLATAHGLDQSDSLVRFVGLALHSNRCCGVWADSED